MLFCDRDDIAAADTNNFGTVSSRLDFEVLVMIVDPGVGSEMAAMFEADFAHAKRMEPNEFDRRSICWWLAFRVARPASPVL